jgi:hypothetical protein
MKKILEFIVQGKDNKFPGKHKVLQSLRIGNEVILMACKNVDSNQIILLDSEFERAGCIPVNPHKKTEYNLLLALIEQGQEVFVKAQWHSDFYYKVQITIFTNTN